MRGAAGAAAVGGLTLVGCGPGGKGTAPATQNGVITITFQPCLSVAGAKGMPFVKQALAEFSSQGGPKGINVQPVLQPGTASNVAALVEGSSADVIEDFKFAPYVDAGLLAPLDSYLQQDGIKTSIWSKGQIDVLQQGGHLYGLPVYLGTVVYALNLDVFDAAGQAYPSTDWTYKEFETLCGNLTATVNGKTRYGGMLYQWDNQIDGSRWIFNAFGGSLMNSAATESTLSAPGSIQAGQWMFEKMFWPKIATTRSSPYQAPFQQGLIAMRTLGIWELLPGVEAYQDAFKWDIWPFPTFPNGRATFGTDTFYGLSATSKHPDQAWEVMKWASTSRYWQIFDMKLQLFAPATLDLWEYWESFMGQVAPPLAKKQIKWFADAAINNYAVCPKYYAYDDASCEAITAQTQSLLFNTPGTSIHATYQNTDAQVNAILQQGAQYAAKSSAIAAQISSASSAGSGYDYPAPSQTGFGTAATPAPFLLASGGSGAYTLTCDGADVWGTADQCAFAGSAETASVATYTCRITDLTNVNATGIQPFARVGLMARGDLSDDAPFVGVAATGANGVIIFFRKSGGSAAAQQLPATAKTATGLIGASVLIPTPSNNPGTNNLKAPVYLRLQRGNATWAAFTSLDGTTYTPAGNPVTVDIAGAWVGLFGTSHTTGTIAGTFDHLTNFAPTTVVQIGTLPSGVGPSSSASSSTSATAKA